ncbi:hypothetical protein C493_20586 [Natronolimnohabitans innermongolicus JCM 12255]|uniref:Uncharacterized protein n=2 Tax=Natronolimnohabitans innermongolicus TaxID=253107 RepID=L9WJ90_9EURY|nr:hypothetical protein C493_20586 [Natronolimnohabitans innermongolicus JCM 12255]
MWAASFLSVEMALERRNLLRLTGAAAVASTAGLAGCLGGSDDENGSGDDPTSSQSAPYRNWLASTDDDAVFVAHLDWSGLEALENGDSESVIGGEDADDEDQDLDDGETPLEDEEDLLLAAPLMGTFFVAVGTLGLLGTGLEELLDSEDDTGGEDDSTADDADGDPADFETTVDDVFWVNDAYVITGDVETDEIHEILTEDPDDEFGMKTVYEPTDEIGGFDIYEPVEDDSAFTSTEDAIAVGEDAIALSMGSEGEPTDDLRGPLEAYSGDGDRAVDEHDDLSWLLETAGSGHVAFGAFGDLENEEDLEIGDDEDHDELAGATGFFGSMSVESESESSLAFAAVFDELDDDQEAELSAELGTSTTDADLEFDADRVSATATWDENALAGSD